MPIKLLRYLLYILLGLALAFAIIGLWLRFEFARVNTDAREVGPVGDSAIASLATTDSDSSTCNEQYPNNRAWFGALHIHTAASYDATAFGVTNTVDDAYSFGRGQPVALRLRDDDPLYEPPSLRISSPLDFMAVTDHAEGLGENQLCYTQDSEAYGTLVCRLFRGDLRLPVNETLQPMIRLATLAVFGQDRSARVCGEDGVRCLQRSAQAWQHNQRRTEAWLDDTSACEFTTFHAYEYTLAEEASNLHRNIIFKTASVPQSILSAKEAPTPESLWQWLDRSCIAGDAQCDVLAIPHNSNWSSGRMWFPYSRSDLPFTERQRLARLRARLEPLAEILH